MDKSKRRLEILEILQKQQKVEVNELINRFGVSAMTVRRDLAFLVRQYNITRTHGGATISNQPVVRMVSFDEALISNKQAKEKIASKAISFIRSGQRIYIDAGSTTRIILNYMTEDLRAVVVTNHLKVAEQALQFDNLNVIMLGGEMIKITNCSSGPVTEEQIKNYPLDIAFLGAGAIGTDGKLYDGYSPEARFKTTFFSVAKRVYILADSTKLNTYELNAFGSLHQVAGVITDAGIDEEGLNLLKKWDTEVIIAE